MFPFYFLRKINIAVSLFEADPFWKQYCCQGHSKRGRGSIFLKLNQTAFSLTTKFCGKCFQLLLWVRYPHEKSFRFSINNARKPWLEWQASQFYLCCLIEWFSITYSKVLANRPCARWVVSVCALNGFPLQLCVLSAPNSIIFGVFYKCDLVVPDGQ